MLKREIVVPPEHLYPPDEWRVVEARYSEEFFERAETIFSLGNGYVGMRGTFEEGRPALSPGTFVNGFHETWPIVHAEEAYGLARTGQTIVNVPDVKIIRLYVDDEPLLRADRARPRLRAGPRHAGRRAAPLARVGTPSGKRVRVESSRMVSLEHRHLAVDDVRGDAARRRRPGGDLLPGAQPAGRPGRAVARRPSISPATPGGHRSPHRVLIPHSHRLTGAAHPAGYRCATAG